MSAPEARIAHQIGGRVRLAVASKKRDRTFFEAIETALRNLADVEEVEINPLTGTVLIRFRGKWSAVADHIESASLLKVTRKSGKKPAWPTKVFAELRGLDRRLGQATGDELNLASLMGLTFIGLGVVQALRKQWLPPASTLWSEGFGILAKLSQPLDD